MDLSKILLEKLKAKETKLLKQLERVDNEKAQKEIKRSLKVIRAQQKKGKKISGTFFYLDKEPDKNYDDLACEWNLTTSCHPIDLMKQLEF